MEAQTATTTEFGAVLAGPRLDALAVNGSVNLRQTWAYARRQPLRARSYASLDAPTETPGPRSRYASVDAWLWGYVPAGSIPILAYWEVAGVHLLSDPAPRAVFEEYLRATLNGRNALMVRSVIWHVSFGESLLVGPAADAVVSPEPAALVRVGGSVNLQITKHLSSSVLLSVPVLSPDTLDWFTQSWGIGRLTYFWSTGEPRPGL
jgi:hypothetical protein